MQASDRVDPSFLIFPVVLSAMFEDVENTWSFMYPLYDFQDEFDTFQLAQTRSQLQALRKAVEGVASEFGMQIA